MRTHSAWPQWLLVPAAPVRDGAGYGFDYGAGDDAGQAGVLQVRLLDMVADHGAAQPDRWTESSVTLRDHGASGLGVRANAPIACAVNGVGGDSESIGSGAPKSREVLLPHRMCLGALFCPAPRDCDLAASATEARLDLGRHDAVRVDPQAQCFDLGPGTLDSRLGAAMDGHQLDRALSAGRQAVERAKLDGVALILARGDEAGVGACITNQAWRHLLHDGGLVEHEDPDATLIGKRHAETLDRADPYQTLRCLGGFEHAALVGSALAAAQLGLSWRAVGTSARIALLLALRMNPSARSWLGVTSAMRQLQVGSGFCLQYAALLASMET